MKHKLLKFKQWWDVHYFTPFVTVRKMKGAGAVLYSTLTPVFAQDIRESFRFLDYNSWFVTVSDMNKISEFLYTRVIYCRAYGHPNGSETDVVR